MIPNMKFYVISIVAIFAALGIGIYIGFALDAQSFVIDQREDIIAKLEERFDFLKDENQELKSKLKELELENNDFKEFIENTYEEIIKDKLLGKKVAVIETKDDYMYSGIGQTLEVAGATVKSVTTITDKIMNEVVLRNIYNELNDLEMSDNKNTNWIFNAVKDVTTSIITGEPTESMNKIIEEQIVDIVGNIDEPVDYIIIAGGSVKEEIDRINLIDKTIIDVAKTLNKPIIGIEKTIVNYSYIGTYKNFRISTIDNVDTPIGKTSLILAMEGRPGHYGVKQTAEQLFPDIKSTALEIIEKR
ncbi:copper transport outer membrane protein MctB [Keratinibaculum paraultunense]|uniref:Copper transport outer membrane protein MctB n=1 Tax=Keratinibaculum paraultunense TaxID=1278232 RepID=A0A4R3KZU3_9FIRM|nr:copper transporter [Keratinibaculum paraultunense]QQY80627.1 copper transporter [Keratinibaculum paraultunense]TCS91359.1 copper transport outer membrane protein MctB [Keratinibaculum paraultunense]